MHHHVDWNSVIFLFTNEVSYAFECPWSLRNVVIQVPCHDLVRNIMKLKCYGCHYSNWKQKAQTFSPIFYVGSWGVYDFLRAKWLYNSHASWWSLLGGMQGLRYTQVNETYMANFSTSMKHLEYCYPPSPQVTLQWALQGYLSAVCHEYPLIHLLSEEWQSGARFLVKRKQRNGKTLELGLPDSTPPF